MEIHRFSLLDSLSDEPWLKLPFGAMREVGPAVQTFGGLLQITDRKTFVPVETIAGEARVPLATARKHLLKLNKAGWIVQHGRQKTDRGILRRTATISIPQQAKNRIKPYGVLPWWACARIRKVGSLSWSTKAILAVVLSRLMTLKAAVERTDNLNNEDFENAIETLGGEDRFRFSLDELEERTGLHRESIVRAKRALHRHRIIRWTKQAPIRGEDSPTDLLLPNWNFRVVISPASPERCFFDFEEEAESG
ncbi:MAG: hypothetical protein ACOX1P_21480 [Thermoguttaceae bacterium]|jgi:hypothetical protein